MLIMLSQDDRVMHSKKDVNDCKYVPVFVRTRNKRVKGDISNASMLPSNCCVP